MKQTSKRPEQFKRGEHCANAPLTRKVSPVDLLDANEYTVGEAHKLVETSSKSWIIVQKMAKALLLEYKYKRVVSLTSSEKQTK